MKWILIGLIKCYQVLLSPWLGNHCRFYPSCSEYACQSLKRYGFWKGLGLSFSRIIRCHPYHPGGVDPVP